MWNHFNNFSFSISFSLKGCYQFMLKIVLRANNLVPACDMSQHKNYCNLFLTF